VTYDYRFTVFTPTFDRAHFLPRVYESLKRQTFRDFEWLIVDDGSADGTRELVAGWMGENPFPIRYFWQPNSGKHVAFNRAAREARGELLLGVDSDDECLPHALERMAKHWADIQALPPAESATFDSVTALCQDQHGKLISTPLPHDVVDSTSSEMKYRYHSKGDRWGFHRTAVFREFPFPELPGHTFVPESLVWFAMGRKYRTRYVNETLLVVWLHDAARLTTAGVNPAIAPGQALFRREELNTNLRYFRYAPIELTKTAIQYTRYSLHAGDAVRTQRRQLASPAARALWFATAPLGWLFYRRDLRRATIPVARTAPAPTAIRQGP
jgi:glycosyltransferase involved in cell wall biosynthesis